MIKINDKNRSLVFLGGTLSLGILIILTLALLENNDVESFKIIDDQESTNYKELEKKTDDLKNQAFSPASYNTLASEIDGSYQQELITSSAKTNLTTKLNTNYSDLVYKQCELFLTNDSNNSTEVLSYLSQLEKITSTNERINYYRKQIKYYNYYAIVLPKSVSNFISPGITNYEDSKYAQLKNEAQDMPNLDLKYKNRIKFNNIKAQLIAALDEFNTKYYMSINNEN